MTFSQHLNQMWELYKNVVLFYKISTDIRYIFASFIQCFTLWICLFKVKNKEVVGNVGIPYHFFFV